jgi:hypothetical protein
MAEDVEDQLVTVTEEETGEDIDSLRIPVKVQRGNKALTEHQRIVDFMGLTGAQHVGQYELEKYLSDNHYTVYPLTAVEKYMNGKVSQFPKVKRRKRYSTTTITVKWRWVAMRSGQCGWDNKTGRPIVYQQTIPVEVLMTAEKIFRDLGDRVEFQVTEVYKHKSVVHADPFLCVTAPGLQRYVIERWDEPAFRR